MPRIIPSTIPAIEYPERRKRKPRTPAPNITDVTHSDDFESYDANSISTDWNWAAYINQFDGSGNYTGGYAVAPAPIAGPQISAVNITDSGNSLNVYSNYDDGTHNGGILETNVFRELGADQGYITAVMVGFYQMKFVGDVHFVS